MAKYQFATLKPILNFCIEVCIMFIVNHLTSLATGDLYFLSCILCTKFTKLNITGKVNLLSIHKPTCFSFKITNYISIKLNIKSALAIINNIITHNLIYPKLHV